MGVIIAIALQRRTLAMSCGAKRRQLHGLAGQTYSSGSVYFKARLGQGFIRCSDLCATERADERRAKVTRSCRELGITLRKTIEVLLDRKLLLEESF